MVQVQKKQNGNANQVVNDEPFVDERKPSSMTAVKGNLHNGEHTLIPVTVKMIHSAVQDCEWFVLKDGRQLHMVKLVGAVRNFCVHDKQVIDKCNGNCYIRVIGEVVEYYGVHEIIAFNI